MDDDVKVTTSNCTSAAERSIKIPWQPPALQSLGATAQQLFGSPSQQYLNIISILTNKTIADTGATSIFIMEGTPVKNLRPALQQLTINLPDRSKVKSTHMCNITISSLPTVLKGHIIPRLTVASLIGIRVLCEAGYLVLFTKLECNVIYKKKVILRGYKDPSTNLWTLPIKANENDIKGKVDTPHKNPPASKATKTIDLGTKSIDSTTFKRIDLAAFTHSIRTQANSIMFAHQSLCNPKISTLLKVTQHGFVQGCPNMAEGLILKYLNPSPATAKGHMKQP